MNHKKELSKAKLISIACSIIIVICSITTLIVINFSTKTKDNKITLRSDKELELLKKEFQDIDERYNLAETNIETLLKEFNSIEAGLYSNSISIEDFNNRKKDIILKCDENINSIKNISPSKTFSDYFSARLYLMSLTNETLKGNRQRSEYKAEVQKYKILISENKQKLSNLIQN